MTADAPARPLRIAALHWCAGEVGGAERYLSSVLPRLRSAGHEVALLTETPVPPAHEPIAIGRGASAWTIAEHGADAALERLRGWRPDVVFAHIVDSPELVAAAMEIAPAVYFAHAYYGTCVSGQKTWKSPHPTPCARQLGPGCLVHYYPHRCGGLSPVTMLRDYALQRRRQGMLPRYALALAGSGHMRDELVRNGCPPDRVRVVTMPVDDGGGGAPVERPLPGPGEPLELLFLGRMDRLKGGRELIDAAVHVRARLARPVALTFAGDGPERADWEAYGRATAGEGLEIRFVGRVPGDAVTALYRSADLLVVPSLWPEPFGLVGPEAGLNGLPAAAFDVGGVGEWLTDGAGGHLAPGDPPTRDGLAEAIVRCVADPGHHANLRRGAFDAARRFGADLHLRQLVDALAAAAAGERKTACLANS